MGLALRGATCHLGPQLEGSGGLSSSSVKQPGFVAQLVSDFESSAESCLHLESHLRTCLLTFFSPLGHHLNWLPESLLHCRCQLNPFAPRVSASLIKQVLCGLGGVSGRRRLARQILLLVRRSGSLYRKIPRGRKSQL